jgi:hypothetical protein
MIRNRKLGTQVKGIFNICHRSTVHLGIEVLDRAATSASKVSTVPYRCTHFASIRLFTDDGHCDRGRCLHDEKDRNMIISTWTL